jgi:DAACS family dicarboxylate/amino acid:cation (Na+ or H+) symporter
MKTPLHARILLGLVAGAFAGIAANATLGGNDRRVEWFVSQITEPVGELFLRLLLMTVVPLVFSSLVVGVAGIGEIRKLGRIGLKCLIYTIVISSISVAIGLALTNLIQPGRRINPATAEALMARYGTEAAQRVQAAGTTSSNLSPLMQVVQTIVPANPVAAVASATPNMLHLMFFAVIVAIGITFLSADRMRPLIQVLESVFEISTKIIDLVMKVAPFAVACLRAAGPGAAHVRRLLAVIETSCPCFSG